jgi:hypothetical protein
MVSHQVEKARQIAWVACHRTTASSIAWWRSRCAANIKYTGKTTREVQNDVWLVRKYESAIRECGYIAEGYHNCDNNEGAWAGERAASNHPHSEGTPMLVDLHQVVRTVFSSSDPSAPNAGMFLLHTSGGHGDGVLVLPMTCDMLVTCDLFT